MLEGWEGSLKISWVQPPCHGQEHLTLNQAAPSLLKVYESRSKENILSLAVKKELVKFCFQKLRLNQHHTIPHLQLRIIQLYYVGEFHMTV